MSMNPTPRPAAMTSSFSAPSANSEACPPTDVPAETPPLDPRAEAHALIRAIIAAEGGEAMESPPLPPPTSNEPVGFMNSGQNS